MADWPATVEQSRYTTVGAVTGTTTGTVVAAAASANADTGAFVTIVASTSKDCNGFFLCVHAGVASTLTDSLVSIAIGAAGAEKKIIDNLLVMRSLDTDGSHGGPYHYFPIPIPAGTRISAKARSSTANSDVIVVMHLVESGFLEGVVLGRMTTYGVNTVDSGGTPCDPGGTAHTRTWTQITSSTTAPAHLLYIAIGFLVNQTATVCNWLLTVAKGASGAEANNILIENLLIAMRSGNDVPVPTFIGPFPCEISSGERLAIGLQCSITDAADRLIDVALYTLE
jgi:hypothetical protein